MTVSAGTFTFLRLDSISLPPGVDLNQMVDGKATSGVWYTRGAGLIKNPSAADSLGTVLTKLRC